MMLFIVGCPRSGTTWVQRMIGAHPDVHMTSPSDVGRLDAGASMESRVFDMFPPKEAAEKMRRVAGEHPGKVIAEKTPKHALHIDEIHQEMPEAKFLWVHRHPLGVCASWVHTFVGHSAAEGAQQYVDTMKAMEPHQDEDYVYRVEYELLLEGPQNEMFGPFAWAGLDTAYLEQCIGVDTRDIRRRGEARSWETELNPKMRAAAEQVLQQRTLL